MVKFTPPPLPENPTSNQWKWWKTCFMDGLGINEITEDAHKLTFLRSHAGAELFSLLEGATDFNTAIGILDAQFETPTRVLFARHNLLSCKQKPEENVNDFVKRLKILVQRCECVDISADEHKNLLLRDALVNGVHSDQVRVRLLELDGGLPCRFFHV